MTRQSKAEDREGLELEQDVEFQEREWRLQRVAWVAMALVVLAALAGLIGPGPLSATRTEAGGVGARYDRFMRYGVDTELEISVRDVPADSVVVRFARAYLEKFDVIQIHPEPAAHFAAAGTLAHVFRFSGAPARVLYRLEPKSPGRARGAVSVDGAGAVTVDAFVYP